MERIMQFKFRLSLFLCELNRGPEAEQLLMEIVSGLDSDNPLRLQSLCALADVQWINDKVVTQHSDALSAAPLEDLEGSQYDTLLHKLFGKYNEGLELQPALCTTLEEVVSMCPPSGPYGKYHSYYLKMVGMMMCTAPINSLHRYNLRLQVLEHCYKAIHGRSGKAKGHPSSSWMCMDFKRRVVYLKLSLCDGTAAAGDE